MSSAEIYLPADVLVRRLMRRVTKTRTCWIFNGCVNSRGYGSVGAGRKSKSVLAHRLVVIARDGEIPGDMTVDHTCEVKRCVNPAHLQVVSRGENTSLHFLRRAARRLADANRKERAA